jgi:hypothetical protein
MTRQITKIAAMVTVILGLMASSTMAQKADGNGFAPIGLYTGTETMPGTSDPTNLMCYGNTFVLNSFGEWESYHLTVSLDYSTDSINPGSLIVTGGTWSLVVIRENQYAGTLYGEIQTGSVNFNTNTNGDQISKSVYLNLKANGGMGTFSGRASEKITGVYDMKSDLRSNATNGNASFTF